MLLIGAFDLITRYTGRTPERVTPNDDFIKDLQDITLEVTNFDQGRVRGITCKKDSQVIVCEALID